MAAVSKSARSNRMTRPASHMPSPAPVANRGFGCGATHRPVADLLEKRRQPVRMAQPRMHARELADRAVDQRLGARLGHVPALAPGLLPGFDRFGETAVMVVGEAEIGQ